MSPLAQRIAIAEACGYEWCRIGVVEKPFRMLCIMNPLYDKADMTEPVCNAQYMWDHGDVPNYPSDSNAIRAALLQLITTSDQKMIFSGQLNKLLGCCTGESADEFFDVATAKPEQLAEALLRTFLLWDDSK